MNLPIIAYSALGALGLAAATGLLGYRAGHDAAVTQAQADLAKHLARAIEQADQVATQDRDVLQASEARRTRIQTVFQEIEREAIRYVALHITDAECLDADGLRLWRAANLGPDAATTAAPVDTLSAPAHADVGQGPRPTLESHSGGEDLSRLPGAAPRTGGLDFRPHWGWQ